MTSKIMLRTCGKYTAFTACSAQDCYCSDFTERWFFGGIKLLANDANTVPGIREAFGKRKVFYFFNVRYWHAADRLRDHHVCCE